MKTFKVSVRSLVAHSLRSGDLNLSAEPAHPVDGTRLHQIVQKSRGAGYQSEVAVGRTASREGCQLRVRGRIDGVFTLPDGVIVEEIKTTGGDLDRIDGWGNLLHWGQAKVYAGIYAGDNGLDRIGVRLTYVHRRSGRMRNFSKEFESAELERQFERLVDLYIDWMRALDAHRRTRDASLEEAGFPFPDYRPGQRRLAVEVYRALAGGRRLLAQAPTGIGKTMAVLFPALKAVSQGFADRLLYVTPRTTGKAVAEANLERLRKRGLLLKSVTLTAREKICFNPGKACDGDECEFARGYYDRVGEARRRLLDLQRCDRPTIEGTARKHTVCPFALSMEWARWADAVVCDYHYVFSPGAAASPLGAEEESRFLAVDEAHNLVDRAREMYSAQIRLSSFARLRRTFKAIDPALARSLGAVAAKLRKIRKNWGQSEDEGHRKDPPSELFSPLRRFVDKAENWLAEGNRDPAPGKALLDVYFEGLRFLRVGEEFGEAHSTCWRQSKGDFSVTLFCHDPSARLSEIFRRFSGAALFSATLTPLDSYRRQLGCGPDAAGLSLPSPFPRRNLCLALSNRISTTYRTRLETSREVARMLATFVSGKTGNYLLFFPSYQYLEMVRKPFLEFSPGIVALPQEPGMTEADRDAFLKRFEDNGKRTLAGLAVLGGVFSEGIDLAGERLTGAAIVGVGLPAVSAERESVRRYHKGGEGYEIAYRVPGVQRVLQAAGRVIRSESDRGAVLLVDPRFTHAVYRRLLPPEWTPVRVGDERDLARALSRFWQPTPGPGGREP